MIGIWSFILTASAFRPDPSIYIGSEPARIHRFHQERQAMLRYGEAWRPWAETGWLARFDERTGTPQWAWGPPVQLGALPNIAAVEREVRAVFAANPGALGVPMESLALGRSGYVETQDAWLVHFDQVIPGTDVRVWRGGVRVRIKHGRLIGFGVDTHAEVENMSPQAAIPAEQAQARAIAAGPASNGAEHTDIKAQLMVLPIDDGARLTPTLVWEVRSKTKTPKGHWVSFVDAQSGALLHVYNEVRFLAGSAHAEHDLRTVNGEMAVSPMRGLRVQTEGSATYTDEDGNWALDIDDPPEGDMVGRYLRVRNEGGADAAFEMLSGDLTFTDEDATQAELDTWIFQGQIREWALRYAPGLSLSDSRLEVYVNLSETCNAYFDGTLNFYQAGGGCNNTGRIADVSYHEWGHGFHYYNLVSGEFDGAISEGIGDSVAVLNTGDYVISPYFFTSGGGIRELSSDRVYPDDWVNQVHEDGLIFGGAIWDLWGALEDDLGAEDGYDTVSTLLVEATKAGPTIPQSFEEMLVADDDNGDLSDGTPNSCAIIDAFSRHGLGPAGGSGSVVQLVHEPVAAAPPLVSIAIDAEGLNLSPECVDAELDSATLHYSTDGGETWETTALEGSLEALDGVIPPQPEGTVVEYYMTLNVDEAGRTLAPSGGAINPFTVYVGFLEEVYCEDFEATDGGYTHALLAGQNDEGADDWMWGTPLGLGGDPNFAASGDKVWGNDLGGGNYNGEYQNSKHNRLTSAPIELGDATEYVLTYRRWLHVEDGYYDQANIVVDDVVEWTNHATVRSIGDEHHQDSQWMLHSVPFSAEAGATVEIGWEIVTDQGLTMGGWNIDDVCVYAVSDAPPESGEDEPGDDSPGGNAVDADGPVVLEGGAKGCTCSASPSMGRSAWFGLLLTGLIAAGRRRQR